CYAKEVIKKGESCPKGSLSLSLELHILYLLEILKKGKFFLNLGKEKDCKTPLSSRQVSLGYI
ncbi:hypothetical protein IGI04_022425, partial [Brassica rapa subsp. trilocularis]